MSKRLFTITILGLACLQTALGQTQTKFEELRDFAKSAQDKAMKEHAFALEFAKAHKLPTRIVTANGSVAEIAKVFNGLPMYRMTDNVNAAKSTRANKVHPGGGFGLTLTGAGVTMGVWDGDHGQLNHPEFTGGRVVGGGDGTEQGDHATHVIGTMVAAGTDPNAKGMSYAGNVKSFEWTADTAEMAAEAAMGLRISNHSYGYISGWSPNTYWYWYGDATISQTEDYSFGFYTEGARAWDDLAYKAPYYLIVKSAGNDRNQGPQTQPYGHYYLVNGDWVYSQTVRDLDGGASGYDTVGHESVAKNILTVGAVDDVVNYVNAASVPMSTFSCWGPTDDGRIKPDVVGNGVGVFSSVTGSGYDSYNGTSMASPNVAGSLGLLVQYYRILHGGMDMRAASLKGLVIHTADEAGATTGPDYRFGWGLMNTLGAASLLSNGNTNGTRLGETELNAGHLSRTYPFTTTAPAIVKITVSWTDAPGPVIAPALDPTTKTLVTDLQTRLTASNGAITLPYVLNPASPGAAATKGDNSRDNVEQIVASVPAGTHTLVVSARGNLLPKGSQAYSILISGAINYAPTSLRGFSISPTTVLAGQKANGLIDMNTPVQNGGVNVAVTDNSTVLITPATVNMPAGSFDKSFQIGTDYVAAAVTRQVTVSYLGISRVANLTVKPLGLDTLGVSLTKVESGNPVTGTVTLSMTPKVATAVALSSNSSVLVVPASATVPTNSPSKTFTATTGAVSAPATRTITAKLADVTKTANVTIYPRVSLASLNPYQPSIEGGRSTSVQVVLSAYPYLQSAVVALSDNTTAITVPATVTVGSNTNAQSFTATTSPVSASVTRQIYAAFRGVTKTANLTLSATSMPVSLTLNPTSVKGGATSVATAKATVPAVDSNVAFGASFESPASGGSTQYFAVGQTEKTFNVFTSTVTATKTVQIVIGRYGVTKTASLTITP